MEMEDDSNQPSNTSGQVGERKRFEVKKVMDKLIIVNLN